MKNIGTVLIIAGVIVFLAPRLDVSLPGGVIAFQTLYCLVIVRHGRRLWVSFGVTANPTAEWISRQITEAFPFSSHPAPPRSPSPSTMASVHSASGTSAVKVMALRSPFFEIRESTPKQRTFSRRAA